METLHVSLKYHRLKAISFLLNVVLYKYTLCSFAVLAFSLLPYQSYFFSVQGDAGEKFGEKMQSLFLHENPQVN